MEENSQSGEGLISKLRTKIKNFFVDSFWFMKFVARDSLQDVKNIFSNRRTFVYLLFILLFYSIFFLESQTNTFIVWLILFSAIVLDMWLVGDWKNYQRKEKKKKYFSQVHPEKKERLETSHGEDGKEV